MRDDLPNPSSPWFWDFLIGISLVSTVLPVLGLGWALPHVDRARVTEAFSVFRTEQLAAQERFAFGQPWPDRPEDKQSESPDSSLKSTAELRNGAIDIRFNNDFVAANAVLTLRAGVPQASGDTAQPAASTLLWQCGQGEFPAGVVALASDKTNLSDYLLPWSCWRQHVVTR